MSSSSFLTKNASSLFFDVDKIVSQQQSICFRFLQTKSFFLEDFLLKEIELMLSWRFVAAQLFSFAIPNAVLSDQLCDCLL